VREREENVSLLWLEPEALSRAWNRVRENDGCAGADGVTVQRFAVQLDSAWEELKQCVEHGQYRALPLLPIVITKRPGSSETRTLMVPSVRDRVLQTSIGFHLGTVFEDEFLDCSFAYRPHRSVNSAIARIRYLHEHGYQFTASADIASFFDRIDHEQLRERLHARIRQPELLDLLDGWIQASVWDGTSIKPLTAGIPQGSPISPLLANFYLEDFDLALENAGMKLIRYADDFLVLARDREDATNAVAISASQLEKLHLALKDEKTHIASFEDGFRFLGALFSGNDVWIPWERHSRHSRLLAMPHPMPASLVHRWLQPPEATTMAQALAAARHRPIKKTGTDPTNSEENAVAFLYLTQQGSVLRKIGNRLIVEKDETILLDVPYHKLEVVLLFGNIQVTTQAMAELLDVGIPIGLLSRSGELRGRLEPALGKNVPLRLAQFDLYHDAQRSLALARGIVAAKLANSAQVLSSFGDREQIRNPENAAAVQQILDASATTASAATLEILNGIEGSMARLYFDVLMRRNKSVFPWPGRQKHPATDPLNALLSFAYTLVGNELAGLVEGLGLDSYIGSLHQVDYGRRSLALDLVEPFRAPLADRFVLTLINRRQFSEADFEPSDKDGLYLRPESCKRFLAEYEYWMLHSPIGKDAAGFRPVLRATVEEYAAALRNNTAFRPWLYRQAEPNAPDAVRKEPPPGDVNAPPATAEPASMQPVAPEETSPEEPA
jgi:CRISPR-associated protein Cas1